MLELTDLIVKGRGNFELNKDIEKSIIKAIHDDDLTTIQNIINEIYKDDGILRSTYEKQDIDNVYFYTISKECNAEKCALYFKEKIPKYLYSIGLVEDSPYEEKEYTPRIPLITTIGEDENIERICLSDSISGCVSAVPNLGGIHFKEMFCDNLHYLISYPLKLNIFKTEDIIDGNLVSPTHLYRTDKVRDALINHEYWVLNQDLPIYKTVYIEIGEDYEEYIRDNISYEDMLNFCEEDDYYDEYIEGSYTYIDIRSYTVIERENLYIGNSLKFSTKEFCDGKCKLQDIADVAVEAISDNLVRDNDIYHVNICGDTVYIDTEDYCTLNIARIKERICARLNSIYNLNLNEVN